MQHINTQIVLTADADLNIEPISGRISDVAAIVKQDKSTVFGQRKFVNVAPDEVFCPVLCLSDLSEIGDWGAVGVTHFNFKNHNHSSGRSGSGIQ